MIRLFANANYDFIKWRRWAYGLTAAIIIPGFALFLVRGLNYSIEFTGGTLIQVQTAEPVGTERIRGALDAAGIRDAEIQQLDRKSTRLNSSHSQISYAVFCLKKKNGSERSA